ncbi:MAG: lysylphosphatidylglycerol synthase domain-containing protein [Saprospiraceae bacterium]
MLNKTSKVKILNLSIKILLVFLFTFLIYKQVFDKHQISSVFDEVKYKFSTGNLYLLALVFIMVLVNWSLEALKWKILMKNTFHYSFIDSIKIVLTGLAVGLITPFQLGEYIGRGMNIYKDHIKNSLVATFIGSYAQNTFTLLFGIFGLHFLIDKIYELDKLATNSLLIIGIGAIFFYVLIYF